MSTLNVSLELRRHAQAAPGRVAVRVFGRAQRALTFEELERRVDASAWALAGLGLRAGERTALFVPPGIDFVALFHALLRLGALPVLIDPGMGRRALLDCLARVQPSALVGVPRVHLARQLFPARFRNVGLAVAVGRGPALGAHRLERLLRARPEPFPAVAVTAGTPAAVLFTSGSTGPAKGVVHTHGNFTAELEALRMRFGLAPGEVDGACFPLFALFDHALGLTSVFPALDPTRPARCDPAAVHHALEAGRASFAFASPAIWRRVVPWMRARGARFTHLRRATIAGAPVAPALALALKECLPAGGEVHTPYGATEALPVTDVTASELAERRAAIESGAGSAVGRALPGVELALIRVGDEPIARWDERLRVAPGEPGEVCVRGAVVTPRYLDDERANALAKIPAETGTWHRMGDVGRLGPDGMLWFLGRKSHRLETERGVLYPVPLENLFDTTPGVARSARVGAGPRGRERPVLVVERDGSGLPVKELLPRVAARAQALDPPIRDVLLHPHFPVDVRHNAKIRREDLKRWAEARLS